MRTPPPAYYQMRAAYARWFWKLPASLLLLTVALLVGRRGALRPMRAILFAAATAVLLDSIKDRAIYESSKGVYDATPDTMP